VSVSETKSKLIELIAKHQIENPGKKLKTTELSEWAGISRQAFHRFYSDLKPYLAGKPIQSFLEEMDFNSTNDLLSQAQARIAEFETRLADIEHKHQEEIEELKDTYITSLMNDDIALFDASEVRQNMIRHSLHLDTLLKKINSLESELTKEKMKQISAAALSGSKPSFKGKIVTLQPELQVLFDQFERDGDQDKFEQDKDEEVFKLPEKINKCRASGECNVILFIDRYISSFEKFTHEYLCEGALTHVFVRLPLFSQMECKDFLRRMDKKGSVSVHFPFCESEVTSRAQRTFYFRNIPPSEATAADKAQLPSWKDGFSSICAAIVKLGD
jgi:hypothetical protein